MTPDDLRQMITAVPFVPFDLRTVDGRSIPVRGRDFILVSPSGGHAIIYQPDDSRVLLATALIQGADYGPPAPANATSPQANS